MMMSVQGCMKSFVSGQPNAFCIRYADGPAVNIRVKEDGYPRSDNKETIEEAIRLEALREQICK